MSLAGLDVGTTGCKAAVFNPEGKLLALAYREYPLIHPQPGLSEHDVEMVWSKVREVLREVNAQVKRDPIKALSISCHGEAVVPVAKDGSHLYNFVITFDDRTIPQYRRWMEEVGAWRVFELTGMPLHPMYSINKIMWFKENRPDIYERAWKFLCVEDFFNYKLGGEAVIDYSLAARTMAFDVRRLAWSEEILSLAGVDEALLARPAPSGTVVGQVSRQIARELDFSSPVAIVTGGHDQPCGALGAGIIKEGIAMNATGTSDVVCPAFQAPILSKAMLEGNYPCYPHTFPGMYVTIAFNLTGGLLLRWYRDTLCAEERQEAERTGRDVYDIIIERASPEPANIFILPHFVGSGTPSLDPTSRGAILGLTLDTTKADLSRAVLDSTDYEMKLNLETMKRIGIRIEELRAIGGGAKSPFWLQLKADTFGLPVVALKVSEAAGLGTAILAGAAIGEFEGIRQGVEATFRPGRVYEPDPAQNARYEARYRRFVEIYPLLRRFNRSLSEGF